MTGNDESAEAVAYLREAVRRGWLVCGNCDGRKCMACVFREMHDKGADDCRDCCLPVGPQEGGYTYADLRSPFLHWGWDA